MKRKFFDPDPVFVQAATGYVVQTVLTLVAVALGFAFARGYTVASVLLAAFLLASALLSRLTINALVAAARRLGHHDQLYYAVRVEPMVLRPPLREPSKNPAHAATEDTPESRVSHGSPLGSGEFAKPVANRQL